MTYRGYWISRGAYQGTSDDRLDGWYVDKIDAVDILAFCGPPLAE